MGIFVITFLVLLLVIVAMSVGVLMGRQPIKGSCGGVGAALKDPDYVCELCGNDPDKCEEEQQKKVSKETSAASELAYDASKK